MRKIDEKLLKVHAGKMTKDGKGIQQEALYVHFRALGYNRLAKKMLEHVPTYRVNPTNKVEKVKVRFKDIEEFLLGEYDYNNIERDELDQLNHFLAFNKTRKLKLISEGAYKKLTTRSNKPKKREANKSKKPKITYSDAVLMKDIAYDLSTPIARKMFGKLMGEAKEVAGFPSYHTVPKASTFMINQLGAEYVYKQFAKIVDVLKTA